MAKATTSPVPLEASSWATLEGKHPFSMAESQSTKSFMRSYRLTLGSLGFASYFEDPSGRLPPVAVDTKNKLVVLGSGNSTPNLSRSGSSSLGNSQRMYPTALHDRRSFVKMVQLAKKSKDFTQVKEFYGQTFKTPAHICSTFKTGEE